MRRSVLFLLPLLAVLSYVLIKPDLKSEVMEWIQYRGDRSKRLEGGRKSEADTAFLIYAAREKARVQPLRPDEELLAWLHDKVDRNEAEDPSSLLKELQKSMACYASVTAVHTRQATKEDVQKHLLERDSLLDGRFTHYALVFTPVKVGIGWNATLVAGQRIPLFTPENLTRSGGNGTFYSRCHHCGKDHQTQVTGHVQNISLECMGCKRIYAMMAADRTRRFRYVNEYLTGFQPPAFFRNDQTKLQEFMGIWRTVSRNCRYVLDGDDGQTDIWQTSQETHVMGQGDCEDSSILLADWLIARGFDARVALGRFAERGGHAWVVVRLDGKVYLLESTEGAQTEKGPPLLSEVGSRYIPEAVFDRDAFYVRGNSRTKWSGDYWGEKEWVRITPRAGLSEEADPLLAEPASVAKPQVSPATVILPALAP